MADQTKKLLNIASKASDAGTRYVDALRDILECTEEYLAVGTNFTDEMFTNPSPDGKTDLRHLDAYTIGILLADVATSLKANFNVALNHDILLKVRK